MVRLERNFISDTLGITDDKKETFEVINKQAWSQLSFEVECIITNRTFDLWKTKHSEDGSETVACPSDRQIREMFKHRIEDLTYPYIAVSPVELLQSLQNSRVGRVSDYYTRLLTSRINA